MKTEIPINYDIEYPVLLRKYHELCNELCNQRDAALRLADLWESGDYGTLFSDFSNELRAIFKEKP